MLARPGRLLTVAGSFVLFAAATLTRADADLWGHLRFGLDFLRDWRVPTIDPYSFTQDVPWINHEWLSEAQMALAWTLGRSVGLTTLKAILVLVPVAVVWSRLDGARLAVRLATIVVLFFGTIHMWATIRPQLWTFVAFAILCRVLTADRPATLFWLPLIFAIWVNCHGGWIVGLAVLGAWAAGSVLRRPRDVTIWASLLAGCLLATLANPYGWGLWLFMLRTVHMSRAIAEWGPLWGTPWINWLPWFLGCAMILWIAGSVRTAVAARHAARVVLVLIMLAIAAARVMRIESLFVTAALVLGGPFLTVRWPSGSLTGRLSSVGRAATVPITVGAAVVALAIAWHTTRCLTVAGDWAPDAVTAHALDAAQPGRLVTYFDWGEFAIWHFGPRLKVSMDGRRETVYTDARLVEHDAIVSGRPAGLAALAQWDAEYVWLPASSTATRAWLASNGYRIDVSSPRSFIAVRADLPVLRAQVLAGPADCFPE